MKTGVDDLGKHLLRGNKIKLKLFQPCLFESEEGCPGLRNSFDT